MILWLLSACLGTFVSPTADLGPYRVTLPQDLQAVPLDSEKRQSLFLARYRRPEPATDQQVLIARPTPVSSSWSDGGLPTSVSGAREALMPIHYRPTSWLGGDASIGEMTSPDGTVMLMWAAIRDGWLHELQCSAAPDDRALEGCHAIAASMQLTATPSPPTPMPTTTRDERAGPLMVPVPDGWTVGPSDPAAPERVLIAAPPPPTDPLAPRQMSHLGVEVFPEMRKIGAWVDALRQTYAEAGMDLLLQKRFTGTYGDAFLCEYSDGLAVTLTFDTVTPAGMVHVECSDAVSRRNDLRVLCSTVYQGVTVADDGG